MNPPPLPIPAAYAACFTRRWSNGPSAPHMLHVNDIDAAHSGRMCTMALMFWPDATRDLLVECIVHDLGEYAVGDVSTPVKDKLSRSEREALQRREREARAELGQVFIGPLLGARDTARLKFLDRYDAYLMAQINAPHLMGTEGWLKDRERLENLAMEAGVYLPMVGG